MSRWVNAFVKYFYRFSLVSGQVLLFIMTVVPFHIEPSIVTL